MNNADKEREQLAEFLGQAVVLDTRGPLLYLGELAAIGDCFWTLDNADVHDLTDSSTSKELYILDSARHGVRPNRKSVHVRKAEIVSISKLSDVTLY